MSSADDFPAVCSEKLDRVLHGLVKVLIHLVASNAAFIVFKASVEFAYEPIDLVDFWVFHAAYMYVLASAVWLPIPRKRKGVGSTEAKTLMVLTCYLFSYWVLWLISLGSSPCGTCGLLQLNDSEPVQITRTGNELDVPIAALIVGKSGVYTSRVRCRSNDEW